MDINREVNYANEPDLIGTPEGATVIGHTLSIIEIYARKAEDLHPVFHVLIVFGIIFALVIAVGSRDPRNVAIMAITIFSAYLLAFFVITRTEGRRNAELRKDGTELARFLGIPGEGGLVGIFVPTTEAVHHPEGAQPYAVRSLALADVQAIVEIVSMLKHLDILGGSSTFDPGNLFIHESSVDGFRGRALFLVGGPLPNVFVRSLLNDNPFITLEDLGNEISISCKGIATAYSIRPSREDRTIRQVESEPTYGCIMKSLQVNRSIFAIWGLDERGTRGAGRWLAENWKIALQQFGEGEFAAIVRFPPGGTYAPDDVQRHPDESVPILIPVTPSSSTSYALSNQNAT